MDTKIAKVGSDYIPEGLSSNCVDSLKKAGLLDCIGRFRVDPMDERVQRVMRKHNTTLFVL